MVPVHEMRTDEAYRTLGVSPGCRIETARRAFEGLAMQVDPAERGGGQAASEYYMRLKRAHDLLRAKIGTVDPRLDESAKQSVEWRSGMVRFPQYCWSCGTVYGSTFVRGRSKSPVNVCNSCRTRIRGQRIYWKLVKVLTGLVLALGLVLIGVVLGV